jgi:O-antigen/teichoic acid export membrane protein
MFARGRALLASYWTPAGRRALLNLGVLTGCTAVAQGFGFWALIIVTGLGTEEYAAVALGNSVQWYLVAIGTLGLPSLVIRDLTLHPAARDGTISAFLGLTAAASVVAGVLTVAAVWVLPLLPAERVYLTAVALCNIAACLSFVPLYDVEHRQATAALLQLPLDVFNPLVLLALRGVGLLSVEAVAAVYAVRVVLAAVIPAVVYHRFVRPIRWRWDSVHARDLLRGAGPTLATMLLTMLPFHAGLFLTRGWSGPHETGLYGLAITVAFAYLAVGMLAARVIQPHASGEFGTDRTFVRKLIAFAAGFLTLLAGATVAAAYLLVFYILRDEYRAAFLPLVLLVTAMAFLLVAVFANCYLIRFRCERLMMKVYVAGGAVYLISAILLRENGVLGLVTASVIGMAVTATAAVTAVVVLWPNPHPTSG